jgi:hypothetical protein
MYAQTWFKGKIKFVEMDLNPPSHSEGEVISMNFHLTSLEKKRIHKAIELPENKAGIKKLQKYCYKTTKPRKNGALRFQTTINHN